MRRFGKWTVAVIVALLCVMMVGVASAATVASGTCGADGDNLKWVLSSDGVLTISGTGEMSDDNFYSPAPWDEHIYRITSVQIENGVTNIGAGAFMNHKVLSKVSVPSSVTSIGRNAFDGCYHLTGITIPDGVTSIGSFAFRGCQGLTSVTIPASVASIGEEAFRDCFGLRSLTIPQGVTSIGSFAFCGCQGLTSVTIPAGVTSIGSNLFASCTKLTSVTLPSGITSIEKGMFSGCESLTSITIPSTVIRIGADAFSSCDNLTSITIPSSVTSIGDSAFYWCKSLTSVTIPSSVGSIGSYVFSRCTKLTSVTIPSGVTYISDCAFAYCSNLTSIIIPDSVLLIGDTAFLGHGSDLFIIGEPNSTAQTYADGNGIPFIKGTPSGNAAGLDKLATPKLTAADNDVKGVALKWNKVTGAEKYRLLVKEGNDEWTTLTDTTKTTYTWTKAKSGTTYAFTVACVDADGAYSTSDYDTQGLSVTYIAAPKLSSVTNAATGVTIKWGKVTGAENYRVFYKTTGGWKKIADTTGTSYTWTKAKSGTKYSFTVRCVDKAGKNYTSAYDTTGKSITYLATPKLSSVTNAATGITIKWGKVTGAAKYRVYYKTTGGWKKLVDTAKTSYTWTKAKSGTKYTFAVRSLSSTGKTTSAYDTTGKSITYLAAPKVSSVTQTTKGVTIKWGKVTGAAKYRVYYKTTGGWKKLTETTKTSYTWTKGKSGTKYTFTVCALSSTGKTASTYDTKGVSISVK